MATKAARIALGVTVLALLCASCAPQGESSEWAPPGAGPELQGEGFCLVESSFADTARTALVVVGHFTSDPEIVDVQTLLGQSSTGDNTDDGVIEADLEYDVHIWTLDVEEVLQSQGASIANTIQVATAPGLFETDVEGVPIDIGRVGDNRVVVLVEPREFSTATHGDMYGLKDSCQVGASLAIIDASGQIVMDPYGKIPLTSDGEYAVAGSSVKEQLRLD